MNFIYETHKSWCINIHGPRHTDQLRLKYHYKLHVHLRLLRTPLHDGPGVTPLQHRPDGNRRDSRRPDRVKGWPGLRQLLAHVPSLLPHQQLFRNVAAHLGDT